VTNIATSIFDGVKIIEGRWAGTLAPKGEAATKMMTLKGTVDVMGEALMRNHRLFDSRQTATRMCRRDVRHQYRDSLASSLCTERYTRQPAMYSAQGYLVDLYRPGAPVPIMVV